jgi:predicted secreted hydrolase
VRSAGRTRIVSLISMLVASTSGSADPRSAGGVLPSRDSDTPQLRDDGTARASTPYAPVVPGHPLVFPADHGSHPDFRTEWWYITGWLSTDDGETLGFQITFFRTKPDIDETNPSAFTPHQLLIAHAALSDLKLGSLRHDQLVRRAGFGLAEAATGDMNVRVDRWSLRRDQGRGQDSYATDVAAEDFALHLKLAATAPPLVNGDQGFSRKGASQTAASYYYSLPHLKVAGTVERAGRANSVRGEAWLDHEWSSAYLEAGAVGWDWMGINLDDGGALMAFRIRGASGEARWAGGTWRGADGRVETFGPNDVRFEPELTWRSPRTGAVYPVKMRVRTGTRSIELDPLMPDQENDTRLSTGAVYWEGAVQALEGGRRTGRGYLELTGYVEPLKLR